MTPTPQSDPLQRVGVLLGGGNYQQAEHEILRALSLRPDDLRALKLLALVRFKLGRFAEAREAYQALARVAPGDAAVRLNLGLIALRLDWVDEAVAELGVAVRLRPDDRRAWSYLGYAHVRAGRRVEAAQAFRQAGQDVLAAKAEAGQSPAGFMEFAGGGAEAEEAGARALAERPADETPTPGPEPFFPRAPAAAPASLAAVGTIEVEGFAPSSTESLPTAPADASQPSVVELSLTNLVLARALPESAATLGAENVSAHGEDLLHFGVRDEAIVATGALVMAGAGLSLAPAHRRAQGRMSEEPLHGHGPFLRCTGTGDLWLSSPRGAPLVAVRLHEDILYFRQERVLAFADALTWEAGRLPGDTLALLQLRGSGRVVLDVSVTGLRAFAVSRGVVCQVPRARLLGWVGRLVASSRDGLCACEGEGMLLLCTAGASPQEGR